MAHVPSVVEQLAASEVLEAETAVGPVHIEEASGPEPEQIVVHQQDCSPRHSNHLVLWEVGLPADHLGDHHIALPLVHREQDVVEQSLHHRQKEKQTLD